MGRDEAKQMEEDDLISLLLQGKQEYENVLQLNVNLRSKCHTVAMTCDRLKEENEHLHAGTLPTALTPIDGIYSRNPSSAA